MKKIFSITTDGAPPTIRKNEGAIALQRKMKLLYDCKFCHCFNTLTIAMSQTVVIENMATVVKIVNYIRAQPLHRWEFLCWLKEYNEYADLVLRTEIRLLSSCLVLQRFKNCLPQILTFLSEKEKEFPLLNNLPVFKFSVGYLTDITSKFNEICVYRVRAFLYAT